MIRYELARTIVKKTGLTMRQAENLIIAFGAVITDALSKGEKIVYSNFGTFYTVTYPSKTILHPVLGSAKKIVMPDTNVVKWMPAENIKKMVDKGETRENVTLHGSRKIATNIGQIQNNPVLENDEIEIPVRANRKTENIGQTATKNPTLCPPSSIPSNESKVNIYEELMRDGSKEETTFNGAIRINKDKPFWKRLLSHSQKPTENETVENISKVSLLDSGLIDKNKLASKLPSVPPPTQQASIASETTGQKVPVSPAVSAGLTLSQASFDRKPDPAKDQAKPDSPQADNKQTNSESNIPPIPDQNKKLLDDKIDKKEDKETDKQIADLTSFNSTISTVPTDISYADLSKTVVPKEILQKIPEKIARRYMAVPVEENETELVVAMTDPEDIEAKELIRKLTQKKLSLRLATEADVNHVLDQYQGFESEVQEAIDNAGDNNKEKISEEEKQSLIDAASEDAPAARIVSSLLRRAIRDKSSDIHIEPADNDVQVRFRIDGVLRKKITYPKDVHLAVVSRIKILSNLKIDEQRLPQDGRFSINVDNRRIDFRVSTMPTACGEKIVMRILDKMTGILSVEELGLTGSGLKILNDNITKAHGMVLVTGPTGSGKTTTLYALISKLFTEGVNIVTLEDPIEYQIPGINQSQVRPDINYTFASGLRSLVRQDPDIIMIGEIRDRDTAEMAVQSALTGHIVLSTLHTNDAAGAAPRLIDMGIEPFLLTSSVNVIVGQRLARKICEDCKEEVKLPEKEIETINKIIDAMPKAEKVELEKKELKFYHGKGCKTCSDTGYRGRTGIYEVLGFDNEIKDLVLKKVSAFEIQKLAIDYGMVTMIQDGIIKALNGTTSIEEVWRVTKD